MRTLGKDHRGYPIPFLVLRDKTGQPHFTINDIRKRAECVRKGLCAICGKPFERSRMFLLEGRGNWNEMWFVGGSRVFLHENGAFTDPPVHRECGEYALRVCPFLAARNWSGRIDAGTVKPGSLPDAIALVKNELMLPALPERFGFGLTYGYAEVDNYPESLLRVRDWRYVEWWHAGEQVSAPDTADPTPVTTVQPAYAIRV